MNTKFIKRHRRAKHTREHIKHLGLEKGIARLVVNRSAQHIYVQVLASKGGQVLASASSLEPNLRSERADIDKVEMAKKVGALVAERAKQSGVEQVACDRGGFKYHGRVAALVESARNNGLVI